MEGGKDRSFDETLAFGGAHGYFRGFLHNKVLSTLKETQFGKIKYGRHVTSTSAL